MSSWKKLDVHGVELSVSRRGDVRKKTHVINGRTFTDWPLTIFQAKNGEKYIMLRSRGFVKNVKVHRLVARAFVPNPAGLEIVSFKDGNRSDPHYKNLEWISRSDVDTTPSKEAAKLSEQDVKTIRARLFEGISGTYLAKYYGVHPSTISKIKNGKRWN